MTLPDKTDTLNDPAHNRNIHLKKKQIIFKIYYNKEAKLIKY